MAQIRAPFTATGMDNAAVASVIARAAGLARHVKKTLVPNTVSTTVLHARASQSPMDGVLRVAVYAMSDGREEPVNMTRVRSIAAVMVNA